MAFRIYSEKEVSTLRFIRRMQALGFSLPEIRELLSVRAVGVRASPRVHNLLKRKLGHVRAKIRELCSLQRDLSLALRNTVEH